MSDQQDRAITRGGEDVPNELLRQVWIEVRGGLVEDQYGGVGEESPGDREALPLPT